MEELIARIHHHYGVLAERTQAAEDARRRAENARQSLAWGKARRIVNKEVNGSNDAAREADQRIAWASLYEAVEEAERIEATCAAALKLAEYEVDALRMELRCRELAGAMQTAADLAASIRGADNG